LSEIFIPLKRKICGLLAANVIETVHKDVSFHYAFSTGAWMMVRWLATVMAASFWLLEVWFS
jgi:hypothetical protein